MFKELKLNRNNIDIYYPLMQKYDLITRISQKYFNGKFLDIGCGKMPYKMEVVKSVEEYIGVDIKNDSYQDIIKPDFYWDGSVLPFENDLIDSSMLIEVLEHVPQPEKTLREINRVLKKGGYLLITVPFLWTLHDVPNDEYRYTPFALRRMLEASNFEIVEIESFGNWHASLASTLALYTKRAPIQSWKKKILSVLTFSIIKILNKLDKKSNHKVFSEGSMITGLWCLAKAK